MDNQYRYTVDFVLKPEVASQELANQLCDRLFNDCWEKYVDSFKVVEENGRWIVRLDDAVFLGNDLENALINGDWLSKVENVQYLCQGDQEHYFYNILDGSLWMCGVIETPDGHWHPVKESEIG